MFSDKCNKLATKAMDKIISNYKPGDDISDLVDYKLSLIPCEEARYSSS